jgi:hypothetical protein
MLKGNIDAPTIYVSIVAVSTMCFALAQKKGHGQHIIV